METFLFSYTVTDFGKAPFHSAYTLTNFGIISLFPYRLTDSEKHLCLPYIVSDYGTYHYTLSVRVTNSSNLFLALVQFQTLATFSLPYRVTDSVIHLFVLQSYRLWLSLVPLCRVENPGKHLFLPYRVTKSDSILGSDHAFTSSLWLNIIHWLMSHFFHSSNFLCLLATQSTTYLLCSALVPRTTER